MPEHAIALRRAWDGWFADGVRRVDLPIRWTRRVEIPSRLSRNFNRPPVDPSRESLWLRFEAVAGLRSASLNGQNLGRAADGKAAWECSIKDAIGWGNRLVIELDSGELPVDEEWGRISVVIRVAEGTPLRNV